MKVFLFTVLSAGGSVACAIIFNSRLKRLPFVGLVGGLAYLLNFYLGQVTNAPLVSMFLSALIIGLISE